jgi:predicted SAM-dependent methyltransferase
MEAILQRIKRLIKPIMVGPTTPLWQAVRNLIFECFVWINSLNSKRAFARIPDQRPVKLHLGCGSDLRDGWVNIDLPPLSGYQKRTTRTLFIAYDLRRGLPMPDNSCDFIYSSHFWEHLDNDDGVRLMQDCYRCLRPGGIFRIVLPDFAKAFAAYLRGDEHYFHLIEPEALHVSPETVTLVDYIHYSVYQYGEHRRIYDEEKLSKLLGWIGYQTVHLSEFQPGIDVDNPLRRSYSLYFEASK